MNNTYFIVIIIFIIFWICYQNNNTQTEIIHRIIKRRKGAYVMSDLLQQYIGKMCMIYTFGDQINGVITEIKDNWILVDCKGVNEVINCDYIKRISEFPKGSKWNK